ncbi:MAG TPA: sulfotransferase [Alphaproteobacteria bacterium]|nr:sulfotransferase [Alphaproteobacteria bacterium]
MPLEVIGAGMGRTGTTSLKVALEQLGFGPCHHMSELFANPASWQHFTRAYAGEKIDWEEAFKGYRSCTDDPGASFACALADRYPNAKVILTVREPEAWWKSARGSALSEDMIAFMNNAPPPLAPIMLMITAMGWDPRVPGKQDRALQIAWYRKHNEEVRRHVASERLLIYQVSEGWEPLCKFLGVPIPKDPFPRLNNTQDFLTMIRGGPAPVEPTGPKF